LAELYSGSDFSSKVTVAKIDATLNDVPDEVSGFPTIKLYPAGSKDSPVEYSGARTLEDLAAFIKDNGKHGIDGLAAKSEDVEMEDASSAASDTMAKAAPAATTAASAAGEGIASAVKLLKPQRLSSRTRTRAVLKSTMNCRLSKILTGGTNTSVYSSSIDVMIKEDFCRIILRRLRRGACYRPSRANYLFLTLHLSAGHGSMSA
jgi:hypothetical protein